MAAPLPPLRWLVLTHRDCVARHPAAAAALRSAIAERGIEATWLTEDWPEGAAVAGSYDGLWVAGGDGSVRRAAEIALDAGLPLSIAPLGTANDFARHFGLAALTMDELVEKTLTARVPLAVDVGRVNGRLFLNACHVGLGAEVAGRVRGTWKRWLGPLAYPLAALLAFGRRRSWRMRLRLGGQGTQVIAATHVIVGNGRFFGGGLTFAPDAAIDDGALDVQAISARWGIWRWVHWGLRRRLGLGFEPDETWLHARARRLTLDLRARRIWANLDGDVYRLTTPLHFQSEKGRLWLWLPEGAMARSAGLVGAAREGARP